MTPATHEAIDHKPGQIDLVIVTMVWISFLAYSLISAPIPAVNEPHYLCKAKHYWQPEWCAGDFFLESTNAHTVFYATVGVLTQWCSLEQTALIGRIVALLILSLGWCNLLLTLHSERWFPLKVCVLFLFFQACGSFSGEWLVGGVEGKVFGYGFLFAALGEVNRGRVISAGAFTGLAISFHPVIGIWGLLAFSGTLLLEIAPAMIRVISRKSASETAEQPVEVGLAGQIPVAHGVYGSLLLLACALPGLIPVYRLLSEAVPEQTKAAANFIQVHYRLAHHLDPRTFLLRAYLCYLGLLVLWIALARRGPSHLAARDKRGQTLSGQAIFESNRLPSKGSAPSCHGLLAERRFNRLVGFSILFAVSGVLIGWSSLPQRSLLLKFYPFRVADLLVPLAVAMGLARIWPSSGGTMLSRAGYASLFVIALVRVHFVSESNRYSAEQTADWISACHWIDEHLAKDVLVFAPHDGRAFKWYAQRAEYVSYKDCPQDAGGIVEWNRRLQFLQKWFNAHFDDEKYTVEELRDFRKQTGITHILTDRIGPVELDPVFGNDTYDVYDLTTLD